MHDRGWARGGSIGGVSARPSDGRTRRSGFRGTKGLAHVFCHACVALQLCTREATRGTTYSVDVPVAYYINSTIGTYKFTKAPECTRHTSASDGPAYVTHVSQQTHEVSATLQKWRAHARRGACLFLSCSFLLVHCVHPFGYNPTVAFPTGVCALLATRVRARELSYKRGERACRCVQTAPNVGAWPQTVPSVTRVGWVG